MDSDTKSPEKLPEQMAADEAESLTGQGEKKDEMFFGRLLVTGDLHGDAGALTIISRKMLAGDVLFVAGDFGFIFLDTNSERCFLDDVDSFLKRKNAWIVFVDGNHENHRALNAYPVEEWQGARVHRIRSRVIHVLRGEILEIKGHKIFCFGGAFSIDRAYRVLNKTYWEEEIPTDEDYKNGNAHLEKCGYQVDFALSHTCPLNMIPYLGGRHSAQEEFQLQNYLQWVHDCAVPYLKCWYFGHWHQDRDLPGKCRVIYLDVVDMETGEVVL